MITAQNCLGFVVQLFAPSGSLVHHGTFMLHIESFRCSPVHNIHTNVNRREAAKWWLRSLWHTVYLTEPVKIVTIIIMIVSLFWHTAERHTALRAHAHHCRDSGSEIFPKTKSYILVICCVIGSVDALPFVFQALASPWGWWEAWRTLRAVSRCTMMAGGEPFAMTSGMTLMLRWCADSWAWGKK